VTPKARPPHGALLITDVKKDDPVYKGNRIKKILSSTLSLGRPLGSTWS